MRTVAGSRQLALDLGTSYSLLVASVDHQTRKASRWLAVGPV